MVNEGQGIVAAFGQLLVDHLGPDRLSPLHLDFAGRFTAFLGHIEPLVGKGPVHTDEHLFLDQVSQGGFHHRPG